VSHRGALALALALATTAAAAGPVEPAADAASAARAQRNFIHDCSGCHLPDGSGSPTKGIPSMRGTLGRFLQVQGGREFIAQVPGVMNSPLKNREIAELMNWLVPYVSSETAPAGTAPYTEEEIARLRRTRPVDVPAARKAVVARARAAGIEIDAEPAKGDSAR
jgi:mono/diheme cytochrome c family protein